MPQDKGTERWKRRCVNVYHYIHQQVYGDEHYLQYVLFILLKMILAKLFTFKYRAEF